MALLASSLVDWNALGKIALAALICGAGVVIAFGLLLLGLKWARGHDGPAGRLAGVSLSAVCAVFVAAAVVIGIYAIAKKPSTAKKPSKSKSAALVVGTD
ncbi:MAG: hypothetical protein JO168_20085 [Solirubrobacterales bacterium]|nr:hypothetical protein [Solirubrobacterales bacterium]